MKPDSGKGLLEGEPAQYPEQEEAEEGPREVRSARV